LPSTLLAFNAAAVVVTLSAQSGVLPREGTMRRLRKVIAIGLAAAGLAVFTAGPAFGDSGGGKVCSPGQQGNPHPGFKPGSC
jgi:hypothetical protein